MKRRSRSRLRPLVTLAVSLLMLLGPFAGLTYRRSTAVQLNEHDCPESGRSHRQVLVLVDQSDPFDAVDREKVISTAVAELSRELEQYDQVVVMSLSAEGNSVPRLWFQKCVPKNPIQGDSFTERLFNPPRATKKKWTAFQSELDVAIRNSLQEDKQVLTPLLETLLAVAKDPELRHADERSILIFSDMIQNSRWLNFYKTIPRISKAADLKISVDPDSFKKTAIYIHHITRNQRQKAKHQYQSEGFRLAVKKFWDLLLADHGAQVVWLDHAGKPL